MVSRMVNRYVEKVVDFLPFWAKSSARKDLKDTIYDMLHDYCGDEIPVGRDVRIILNELGTPESLANQYYEYRAKLRKKRKFNYRKMIVFAETAVLIAAFILVMSGLLMLTFGLTKNMNMMAVGGVMALIIIFTRMLMPLRETPDIHLKKRQTEKSSLRPR